MFGYVKVAEDELKVKEIKRYHSYYCGLCRQIACYSQASRLMLSYDMVFLTLLIEADTPQDMKACKRKVFRRCKKACGDFKLKYIAAISIFLLYDKLKNDVLDGERIKSFVMGVISPGYKKAAAEFPEIHERITSSMQSLYILEQQRCKDFQTLEWCFAGCFSDMFVLAPGEDEFASVRAEIAYHVAAWVYLFDMLVDLEKDKKTNDFNAILLQENEEKGKREVAGRLTAHIARAAELIELLPYSPNVAIIANIVTLGLPVQQEKGVCG